MITFLPHVRLLEDTGYTSTNNKSVHSISLRFHNTKKVGGVSTYSKVEQYTSKKYKVGYTPRKALVATSGSFNYRPLNKMGRVRCIGTQQLLLTDQEDQDFGTMLRWPWYRKVTNIIIFFGGGGGIGLLVVQWIASAVLVFHVYCWDDGMLTMVTRAVY